MPPQTHTCLSVRLMQTDGRCSCFYVLFFLSGGVGGASMLPVSVQGSRGRGLSLGLPSPVFRQVSVSRSVFTQLTSQRCLQFNKGSHHEVTEKLTPVVMSSHHKCLMCTSWMCGL